MTIPPFVPLTVLGDKSLSIYHSCFKEAARIVAHDLFTTGCTGADDLQDFGADILGKIYEYDASASHANIAMFEVL